MNSKENFLRIEELEFLHLEGVKLWVSLDLCLKNPGTGSVEIWDWKTGRFFDGFLAEDLQIATYLWFAKQTFETEDITANLLNLSDETQHLSVHYSEIDFGFFQDQFQESVASMQQLLSDVEGNKAEMDNFPKSGLESDPPHCNSCNFLELCDPNQSLH